MSTSSSVVLPSPLRPTMPIRSPSPTPRETSLSSGRTPYDFETRSRLTRFATAIDQARRTRWAPATGAGRDQHDVVRRREPARDRARLVGRPDQEHDRRAGAGDQPPQRAGVLARGDQVAQLRAQVEGGGLEVVVQRPARGATTSPSWSAVEHVGGLGGRRGRVGVELVERAGRPPGSRARPARRDHHPPPRAPRHRRDAPPRRGRCRARCRRPARTARRCRARPRGASRSSSEVSRPQSRSRRPGRRPRRPSRRPSRPRPGCPCRRRPSPRTLDAVQVGEQPRGAVDDVVARRRAALGRDVTGGPHLRRHQPSAGRAVTSSYSPTAW